MPLRSTVRSSSVAMTCSRACSFRSRSSNDGTMTSWAWRWMKSPMSSTHENSLNLPNAITFSRFVLSLVLFALMQMGNYWLWAAGLFVFAVATDVLDGWIARRYKLITQLGRIMDPFVDKFITGGTFLFLLPVAKASG